MNRPSINQAHEQARKADLLTKSGKYEDAIECHKNAAELFQKSMIDHNTTSPQAMQSLQVQFDFHQRQQALISFRKQTAVTAKQNASLPIFPTDGAIGDHLQSIALKATINATLDKNDSLLALYLRRQQQRAMGDEMTPEPQATVNGTKLPKGEDILIEEQLIRNEHLRIIIDKLVNEMDTLWQHNQQLQEEVVALRQQLRSSYEDVEFASARSQPGSVVGQPGSTVKQPDPVRLPSGPSEATSDLHPLEIPDFDYMKIKTGNRNQ